MLYVGYKQFTLFFTQKNVDTQLFFKCKMYDSQSTTTSRGYSVWNKID